jgi:hypothetical protein
LPASLRGRAFLGRGEQMIFTVKVGISQVMEFHFDCMGDALDFVAICLKNGYRATIYGREVENEV